MKVGRPTKYSEELAEAACTLYAEATGDLREAFKARDDLPDLTTVYRWEQAHPDFRDRLTRARQMRAHMLAESILDIADETAFDTITKTGRDGSEYEVANHEWINRSRLRVESRRWMAQKLNPSTYGDRIQQDGTLEVVHRIHLGPKPE